jgi:hypothetical protein
MQYLTLLYGSADGTMGPGSPGFDEMLARYDRFNELNGEAIVAGDALEGPGTAVTVRPGDGAPLVTDGPFAETAEGIGGLYVLEADTLDDAIELARQIPAATTGGVELRPLVMWQDADAEGGPDMGQAAAAAAPEGSVRWVALLRGKETEADIPGTPAWEEGSAAHGRFSASAGDGLRGGGAVQPLAATTAVRVRDGEVLVTDGPYAEGSEVVGGLYLFRRMHRDAAVALAARIPAEVVELHRVMEVRP